MTSAVCLVAGISSQNAFAEVHIQTKAENKKFKNKTTKTRNIQGQGIFITGDKSVTGKEGGRPPEAKSPGLEISGGTSFNAYGFNQLQKGSKGRGTHFGADDSRINFEVLGRAGPGLDYLEYSFLIGMTGNTESGKTSVEENRIKLKHCYGTILAGVHRGVTDFMSVGAFKFYGGTGGVLGNYKNIVNLTSGTVIKDDPAGHGKDRTKFTYVTPRFIFNSLLGVQFGYSYTPDGEHSGEAKLNTLTSSSGAITAAGQNLHEFGMNVKGELANGFGAQVSLTALIGNNKQLSSNAAVQNPGAPAFNPANPNANRLYGSRNYNDIRSYAIGLVLSFGGFSIGGEYLGNGNSLGLRSFSGSFNGVPGNLIPAAINNGQVTNFTVEGADAGRVYNIGVGYSKDRHSFSLGYLQSDRCLGVAVDVANSANRIDFGKTRAKVYSATYDYKIAKGLKAYVEATHFDYKQSRPDAARIWNEASNGSATYVPNNNGNAFIAGVAISF